MRTRVSWIAKKLSSWAFLKSVLAFFVLMIGASIVVPYVTYFPPNFEKGFLIGKEGYFYSVYALGFYAHIISAPLVLLIGLIQTSHYVRQRTMQLHRTLGTVYACLVLFLMVPGALTIATKAYGGWVSATAFISLSLLTWVFTFIGWKQAKAGLFFSHARWMKRSFILVCSAVVLRILAVESSKWDVVPEVAYPLIAWLSWVPSLCVFEIATWFSLKRPDH
ncbi:MAG: DUF2306 domain-containing protein [Planctomycetota bacterium]|nr:DUF2306 domain-containing protein [Planctomycetota bacterium]